jgi:peroxiredoxin
MKSKIIYKNEEIELIEDFIDVGYMAEEFEAMDIHSNMIEVKRRVEDTPIVIFASFPNYDEYAEEIKELDSFLSDAKVNIKAYLILEDKLEEYEVLKNKLDKFTPIFDTNGDYGELYGTKLESGTLEGKLTKALFVISKDGAIFYIDFPSDLSQKIKIDRLQVELNKAYNTYNGVGCHG